MQRDNLVKQRQRWRRQQLADFWGVSTRTVDRMRVTGLLGPPKYISRRIPTWSDEQREQAERVRPA